LILFIVYLGCEIMKLFGFFLFKILICFVIISFCFGFVSSTPVAISEIVYINSSSSDSSQSVLEKEIVNGGVCNFDVECISNFCVHGFCRSQSFYCGDGHCDENENHQNCFEDCSLVNGGSCSYNRECVSGICYSNKCVSSDWYNDNVLDNETDVDNESDSGSNNELFVVPDRGFDEGGDNLNTTVPDSDIDLISVDDSVSMSDKIYSNSPILLDKQFSSSFPIYTKINVLENKKVDFIIPPNYDGNFMNIDIEVGGVRSEYFTILNKPDYIDVGKPYTFSILFNIDNAFANVLEYIIKVSGDVVKRDEKLESIIYSKKGVLEVHSIAKGVNVIESANVMDGLINASGNVTDEQRDITEKKVNWLDLVLRFSLFILFVFIVGFVVYIVKKGKKKRDREKSESKVDRIKVVNDIKDSL
jgi:hypothetical protein